MILAVFFYIRQLTISFFPPRIYFKKSFCSDSFLWISDHLVILIALGGTLIRIGNFMNSEIIGKPTLSNYGVIFVRSLHDDLAQRYAEKIDCLTISKASTPNLLPITGNYQPIELAITFKETFRDEVVVKNFLEQSLKRYLLQQTHFSEAPNIYETYGKPLSYKLKKHARGYQAHVYTWGVPRHPAQLYEAFSSFLIFILLFVWWYQKGQNLTPGRIFGVFMVLLFSLRFFYEFYKENQVAFEKNMSLNMGQLLSLPLIIMGIFLILRPSKKVTQKEEGISL